MYRKKSKLPGSLHTTSETWPCLPFSLGICPLLYHTFHFGDSPKYSTLCLTSVALLLLSARPEHACHLSSFGSCSPFSITFCHLLSQKVFLQSLGSPVPLLCVPLAPQARLCPSTLIVMLTLSNYMEFVSLGSGFLKGSRHHLLFILVSSDLSVAFGNQQSHICLLSCNSRLCPLRWLFWQTEELSLSQSVPASLHNRGRSAQLRAPESSEIWLLLFR